MKKIQDLFIEKGKTLVLAESCTGGLIASTLTKISGSSGYFLGSFVTYCDAMKADVLGVNKKLLQEKTAISAEVAEQMCMGAIKLSKSDYGVAVTGDAGPAGCRVGTVFGAIGDRNKIFVTKIPGLSGLSREEIQKKCADFLLDSLYTFVKNNEAPFVNQ